MKMKKICFILLFSVCAFYSNGQVTWQNLDSLYQPLPASMHVYKSTSDMEGKPNIMYYAIADLKNRNLQFTTDTASHRRLTPSEFYDKNMRPLLVVNCSFFSFATNQNLNLVVKNGKLVSYNDEDIAAKGKDTLTWFHSFTGTFGISKKRKADIAWTFTDSSKKFPFHSENPVHSIRDSSQKIDLTTIYKRSYKPVKFSKWKVQTAIGGGPVLVQDGEIKISNDEERKFAGRAAFNREPRTAIGYTKEQRIIVWVCEGRSDSAAGLTLLDEAKILKDLGCVEALNLDGGGSSCMLINGKETNTPSSKGVQRPVPSVFLIEKK
jgi:exopolysaccharide biosynthesis protein